MKSPKRGFKTVSKGGKSMTVRTGPNRFQRDSRVDRLAAPKVSKKNESIRDRMGHLLERYT